MRSPRFWISFVALILFPWAAMAHVGSPDVFFDGLVGPYKTHIAIRVPAVVPGLAGIEVRPESRTPVEVSFRPLFADTPGRNAPPAEIAAPTRDEAGLYTGDLWLMITGAYSIEVRVHGEAGDGTVRIPIDSVATHQLPFPGYLAALLVAFGGMLAVGGLGIIHAAVGESVLAADEDVSDASRRRGRIAALITGFIILLAVGGAAYWWYIDIQDFRGKLHEGAWPDLVANVHTNGAQPLLHLTIGAKTLPPAASLSLLRDHGKLVHLFLIREPVLDAFAHVHPVQVDNKEFDLVLPPLPEGDYKLLADLTFQSGFSSTAGGTIHLPDSSAPNNSDSKASDPTTPKSAPSQADPDDSWATYSPSAVAVASTGDAAFKFSDGSQLIWKAHAPLRVRHDPGLRFEVHDANGRPVPLEPYMGMLSHAAVLRKDGAVFSHLHPTGNYSMAAQMSFDSKLAREDGGSSDAMPADMDHSKMHHDIPAGETVSSFTLPYEFPSAGDYRLWIQFKTGGKVLTGVFDATVAP